MRKSFASFSSLVVLALLIDVDPVAAQGGQNPAVAVSTGRVRFMENGNRPVTTSALGVSFMLPIVGGASKTGLIPAIHTGRLATALPRVEARSFREATSARQVAPKRKRPGLWAAVGAGAGAGLGALYARAGHPGLPHAGSDVPDELLYMPVFGAIGALVGAILGNR